MRISDWSSDVCSSDLVGRRACRPDAGCCRKGRYLRYGRLRPSGGRLATSPRPAVLRDTSGKPPAHVGYPVKSLKILLEIHRWPPPDTMARWQVQPRDTGPVECAGSSFRSEEHTSELQSLMRISYAVFCLKK